MAIEYSVRATETEYDRMGRTKRRSFTGYERDGETGLDYAEATLYEEDRGVLLSR
jgi:hypothetical protein